MIQSQSSSTQARIKALLLTIAAAITLKLLREQLGRLSTYLYNIVMLADMVMMKMRPRTMDGQYHSTLIYKCSLLILFTDHIIL